MPGEVNCGMLSKDGASLFGICGLGVVGGKRGQSSRGLYFEVWFSSFGFKGFRPDQKRTDMTATASLEYPQFWNQAAHKCECLR